MDTLNEGLDLVGKVRKDNPQLSSLDDKELADIIFEQSGDERFKPVQGSTMLSRGVAKTGQFFSDLGKSTEEAIASPSSSFPVRVAGRAAGNLVSSAPELAINVAAGATKGLPRLLGFGTGAAFSYGRTKAETGSDSAALGSAAGSLLSLAGGIKGATVGRKLAEKAGAGKVGQFAGGSLGSAAGSVPGDLVEIASSPGGVEEFLADPVNLPAYALGSVGFGAAMDAATEAAEIRQRKREAVKANVPDLRDSVSDTEAAELASLRKIPAGEKLEVHKARERELTQRFNDTEEKLLALKLKDKDVPAAFPTMPEAPATIREQMYLFKHGKKPVVEIQKGTDIPSGIDLIPGYFSHTSSENGNLYLYDERKTNPAAIDAAIKSDSMGTLLGLGSERPPKNPSGQLAVLRNKRGIEKAAVVLGDGNDSAVRTALEKMAIGDDVVTVEPLAQVMKWRQQNYGLKSMKSLFSPQTDATNEISFTNHVLDMFNRSVTGTARKGPRFTVDADARIGAKGLAKAVQDWAPPELWEHYKSRGIEKVLADQPETVHMYTIFGAKEYGKQFVQIDPLVNEGRGEPLTDAQRKALPQPPTDLETGQYVKDGEKWVKLDKNADYADVKAKYERPSGKVKAADFAKFIRENTPEVEVKKLIPKTSGIEERALSRIQHEIDTAGLVYSNGAVRNQAGFIVQLDDKKHGALVQRYNDALTNWRNRALNTSSDAATGRYGIEPKPVNDMTGAVDILVRVPRNEQGIEMGELSNSGIEFRGNHFGDSDKNVLASIRGYEEHLPNGEKVFHVFEIQSDWGQRVSRESILKEEYKEKFPEAGKDFYDTKNHPLLRHYETLAVKTAIQHAREIGAKYIAISDGETAMMTEMHDRQTGQPIIEGITQPEDKTIPQEKGMRAAYDERLPAIAERLTRSKPQRAVFGQNQNAFDVYSGQHGSPVFKDSKGQPKVEITARVFDISNPAPEIKRLFSLYDADKQTALETELRKQSLTAPETRTQKEILARALKGDGSTDIAALTNFLDRLKGLKGVITEGSFADQKQLGQYDFETGNIHLSSDHLKDVRESYVKLAHEMTHGALAELRMTDKATYDYLMDLQDSMGPKVKRGILDEVKKAYGLGDFFDTEYLSGEGVAHDKQDQFYKERAGHEFVAGLMEGVARAHFDANTAPGWMRYLPMPIQRALSFVSRNMKKFFGEDMPSVAAMLHPDARKQLARVTKVIAEKLVTTEQANLNAILGLKKADLFDENTFVQKLPSFHSDMALTGKAGSFMGDVAKQFLGKVQSKYEDYLYSGIFRTRTNPETSEFFWSNHSMRPNIQSEISGYHAGIGQDATGKLSQNQALERWAKWFNDSKSPFNANRQPLLDKFSRVFEENQNRRQRLMEEGKLVTDKDLVSEEELKTTFGLKDEEAQYFQKIQKVPELVMQEKHRKVEQADTYRIAKLFLRANRGQKVPEVVAKVDRLQRIANDFGAKRFELNTYQKLLDAENRSPSPDLERQGIYSENVRTLQSEQEAFKILLDQAIRQEFSGSFQYNPEGPDPFLDTAAEAMVRMAATRAQTRFATKDAGYAPMTRRGRFLLRVYDSSPLGEDFAKVREFKGFDSEKEAKTYIAENSISDYELIDKETLAGRARVSSPDKLKRIRDEAKAALGDVIGRIADRTATNMDPIQRENLLVSLKEIEQSYKPLEDEIKEVVSVMGDKFAERRYNVPGFDRNDFLPNIFEYMNFQTVAGQKMLTRAFGELQIERGELQNNPELRARMEQELDYVLSNQVEYNTARKAVFYYYLGSSIRHVIQNAVQIPLNGVSQMMANGHGLSSYSHFARAAKLAAEYSIKGTTGDKTLDILLKQAEKDGISFQSSIEAPSHDSIELQNALDSINSQSKGNRVFGEKVPYLATKVMKSFEKFLQTTSAAAESGNRKTTFIASVLADRAKGSSDVAGLYKNASEFTNFVNFVGDKPNRPGYLIKLNKNYMHGPVSLASALQSFTINHISQLYSFWKKGFQQGSVADKKALYTGLAHLIAFAGASGFIGVQLGEELYEQLTGTNLETAVRKGLVENLPFEPGTNDRIADGVMHGLPAVAGIDLSNSVGLGSPFFRYQAGQPITAEQFGGAAVGMVGRVASAVSAGAKEVTEDPFDPRQWYQAVDKTLRTGAPTFLSQAQRAFDVMGHGTLLDSKRQPLTDPMNGIQSIGASLGLTPMDATKQRAVNSAIYKSTKRESDNYERVTQNIAHMMYQFEQTGDENWMKSATQAFDRYMERTEGMQNRDSFVSSITDQLQQFRGRVTDPSSLKNLKDRERIQTAYPSVEARPKSRVSSLLDEITTALSLGQDDLLLQKLDSIPSSILEGYISDLLTQGGLPPAVGGLVQRPSSVGHLGRDLDLPALLSRY